MPCRCSSKTGPVAAAEPDGSDEGVEGFDSEDTGPVAGDLGCVQFEFGAGLRTAEVLVYLVGGEEVDIARAVPGRRSV